MELAVLTQGWALRVWSVRQGTWGSKGHQGCNGQGPVSISEKTSFRKISSSLEAARFVFRIVRSFWNLTGTSAAMLPMCLSNFKTIRQFKVPISWLRDFTRSYGKTSFRILRRGPDACDWKQPSARMVFDQHCVTNHIGRLMQERRNSIANCHYRADRSVYTFLCVPCFHVFVS